MMFLNFNNMNIEQLTQDVIDGVESPLKAYGLAKMYADAINRALETIKEAAIAEAGKYPDKIFNVDGFKFEKRAGAKRYDYKHIKEWKMLNDALKATEEKYKTAYNAHRLQLHSVTDDGELVELPVVTNNKDSLIVTPL